MSQELHDRIAKLESELNQSNASAQAAHQTLMETLQNFMNMRTGSILAADRHNTETQNLSARFVAQQTIVNELQKQLVEAKGENAKLHARVANNSESRVFEGEAEKLHLA